MLDKLILIILGFIFGHTLTSVLTSVAVGTKPLVSDVAALVMAVVALVIILGTDWKRRR